MLPPVRNPKQGERGFALLLVFLLAAGIALMLYAQVPRVAFESERDKEQLLIDRGEQYKRAIQEFFIAYKRYPSTIEELEHTNDKRYLRKRYVDPYTGKDEWRLIHSNGMMLTDSLITKPPAGALDPNNPNKDQLASNLGANGGAAGGAGGGAGGFSPITTFTGPGGAPGTPGTGIPGQPSGDVNPAALRRPSDRVVTPGQFSGGAPGAVPDPNNPYATVNPQDPNNPGQVSPGQFLPGQTANGQPVPGQPGIGQAVPGQAFPGQPLPGQPFPGQPAGFPGQNPPGPFGGQPAFPPQPQPDPFNNFNQNPTTDFPPISLQGMQQGNGGGQNNGQFQPGQQFPGQQFPGQLPGQIPGQPGGNQVRIGQNGQFIPVPVNQPFAGQQPGAQGFPAGQTGPGGQPFPGGQSFPGAQPFPGSSPFPGAQPGTQPFPGQPQLTDPSQGGVGPNAGPNNAATNLINQLLTTPRQPPAGVSVGNPASGAGLGIAGVASKYEGASLKLYKERQKFKEWEFVFDPNANAPKAPAQGNPLGPGTGTGNTPVGTAPGSPPPIGGAPPITP